MSCSFSALKASHWLPTPSPSLRGAPGGTGRPSASTSVASPLDLGFGRGIGFFTRGMIFEIVAETVRRGRSRSVGGGRYDGLAPGARQRPAMTGASASRFGPGAAGGSARLPGSQGRMSSPPHGLIVVATDPGLWSRRGQDRDLSAIEGSAGSCWNRGRVWRRWWPMRG